MNEEYRELHRQADRLYHRFRDRADQPDAPAMQALLKDIESIREDFEQQKKPRSIEDRIKRVQAQLKGLEHQGGTLIDFSDADELHDAYEDMRQDLRKLPDY